MAYCIVLYLYIYRALLAVHTNQKRFQCERPREKRAVGVTQNATAQDCSRIDRFINRTVNLGYLPADCQTFNSLVNTAEDRLLSSVIRNSYQVLRPLFPPILTRRSGLCKRAHPFTLPLKDDNQCIPHVLYRALLPPVQS